MKKTIFIIAMLAIGLTGISQITWTANSGSAWNDHLNWNPQQIPTLFDNVVIPSGTAYEPQLINNNAEANNITIESGATLTINANQELHYLGNITVNGTFTVNGIVEMAVVTSADNKVWVNRNLGATQVATSSTDALAYGDLYQWGRLSDGHENRLSDLIGSLSTGDVPGHNDFITHSDWRNPKNDNLWQGISGTNNPCPSGFRLPTKTEWETEINSWSSENAAGAFASPLKLTKTGYRDYGGPLTGVGTLGVYWSSTINGATVEHLILDADATMNGNGFRGSGIAVRCIKD